MKLSARFALLLMMACWFGPRLGYARAHPAPLDQNTNCLECHADHATGDQVHPAEKQGCASCHSIENREGATYIVAKPSKTILCFECHRPEAFSYSHFPYASGDCLRCHNPHVAANPRPLRAQVNELCLKCHQRSPDSVPSPYLPTIVLTADNRLGHPYERHPVRGSHDPLTGLEISCISCHLPHGGAKLHLLKMGAEIPEDALNQNTETNDMCRKCHLILWGLEGATSAKNHKHKKSK
jgi:predicted CXXCH cytochrome family protein